MVLELKEMGFNEVMLADFRFPNSDQYIFNGDKEAALQDAASKLMGTCGGDNFTLSFGVADPAFKLPEGRCRLYLEDVDAANVEAKATLVDVPDIKAQLVFMAATNDTRFDSYSVNPFPERRGNSGSPEGGSGELILCAKQPRRSAGLLTKTQIWGIAWVQGCCQ